PCCAIPFRRDSDFIDRGTLLDELQEKCSAPASRVALVGLGGVGKSQLAIEHCYRTAERSPETWIFWVHASNAARLEQSYRDIANQVKLAGRTDQQENVFELVRDWLRDEKNGKWLLVLDNADDAALLVSLPGHDHQHLTRYLPPSKDGAVVVTSRSGYAASRLVEESDMLHVSPMQDTGAQALLRKKLGVEINTDSIGELAAALEYMPLALVQAAAYIQKRAPHYSVQQYLEEFRRSDKRKASLLNWEAGHLRRNEEANNSIIITWQISFEHIRSTKRSAADVLSLMSFFDRQGIPKALLRIAHGGTRADDGNERDNDEEDSVSEDDIDGGLIDDVLALRDYSFVSETTNPETLEMHSLVQLATQRWLESKGEAEGWKQQFISTLCTAFPTGQYENWGRCQGLFPHAIAALGKRPRSEESCKKWARLLYNAAWYAWQRGRAEDAESLARASMEVRCKLLGAESNETLSSMAMVGLANKLTGRWQAAEQLEVQAMEMTKTKLGADHPVTLAITNNLALTYMNQDRWEAAEQLFVQVIETRKMKAGADHPDTLTGMNNLALTYYNQGRYEAAELLLKEVTEARKTKLGVDHPSTLIGMANLALTYQNQGRYEAAELLLIEVTEARKTKLGVDHPSTLIGMANLAYTWKAQERKAEAIALMRECVQLRRSRLGAAHPHTVSSIAALADWETN
ncbi:P-loop containing nucleoside triphosphate hydrolase protein, partial [Pyrenochaeta sp. MPI-SDFR-AT-0127]